MKVSEREVLYEALGDESRNDKQAGSPIGWRSEEPGKDTMMKG